MHAFAIDSMNIRMQAGCIDKKDSIHCSIEYKQHKNKQNTENIDIQAYKSYNCRPHREYSLNEQQGKVMLSIFIIAFISNSWTKNGGDWLNLTTIQDAYHNHYVEDTSIQVETAIREPVDLDSIIKEAFDNPHSQYKLIFVSDHGAKAIRTLSDLPPNVEIIWSGHQLVAEWEQLPVHKWYLPEHSLPISESHHLRNMIPTRGHNLGPQIIQPCDRWRTHHITVHERSDLDAER